MRARPLHRQKVMGVDVLLTEQADLHLLRFSSYLLVKPLRGYMLSVDFWRQYICPDAELYASACGFLVSYIWLIRSPTDLRIAQELDLVGKGVSWADWRALVGEVVAAIDIDALDGVNRRYDFGELRLSRINTIYRTRFFFSHFIRGYLYGYNRYAVFFERNFAWLVALFVYLSVILSAMQVGNDVPGLGDSFAYQRASYGFVVFSIVVVVAFLVFLAVVFASIFFFNMVGAISHARSARLKREALARTRSLAG